MPLDQQTTDALNRVFQGLDTASREVRHLLGGVNPAPDDKRIEVLQKNFAELSNYDRHYSTTRSALTTLLVTVGLVIAQEPIRQSLANVASQTCIAPHGWFVVTYIARNFAFTLLLFFLAFPVNLYFRKQTLACALIERTIAHEIGTIANLPNVPNLPRRVLNINNPPVRGYYFPEDFRRVVRELRWPWFDEMTTLLLFAVLEFLVVVALLISWPCALWPIWVIVAALAAPGLFVLVLFYVPFGAA
jgi:hypothetical protein